MTEHGRLIDADALTETIGNSADLGGAMGRVVECVKLYAKYMIATAPTIEERKKGKWMVSYLEHEAMGIRPKLLYCSECCQCIAYSTNFCPNCGADMRGEEE